MLSHPFSSCISSFFTVYFICSPPFAVLNKLYHSRNLKEKCSMSAIVEHFSFILF